MPARDGCALIFGRRSSGSASDEGRVAVLTVRLDNGVRSRGRRIDKIEKE
jgi:hypothetical protein